MRRLVVVAPPQKRTKSTELITSLTPAPRKISDVQPSASAMTKTTAAKAKKPQMRYDPDVPMTKEEAAAWRKEQRRKRNRESAAASRQRQRDRITELEEEVNQWKNKYEEALARIEKLEQMRSSNLVGCSVNANTGADCTSSNSPNETTSVSPCSSPRHNPSLSTYEMSNSSCGVVSLQEQSQFEELQNCNTCQGPQEQDENVKHLSEKISRPA